MTTPTPSITGLGAISDTSGKPFSPFAGVTVSDGDPAAMENVTVIFTDQNGNPVDDGGLDGSGIIKSGVGTYILQGSQGGVTDYLHLSTYTPVVNDATTQNVTITDNAADGANATSAKPATGTMNVPAEPAASVSVTAPISGVAGATVSPFAGLTVSDPGRADAVYINPPTVTDADGNLIQGDAFSGAGPENSATGAYTLQVASDSQITSELQQVAYTIPQNAAAVTFHLSVLGSDGTRSNVVFSNPAMSVTPATPASPSPSPAGGDTGTQPAAQPTPVGGSAPQPSGVGAAGAIGPNGPSGTPAIAPPSPSISGSAGGAAPPTTGGSFSITDMTTGQLSTAGGSSFTTATTDSLGITANAPSVFIQSGTGNDIIQATAGGNNVLADTGGQVNFEIGGSGTDTFFLDARNSPVSWNTIAGLHSGDTAIVYGISPQDLAGNALANAGVTGYQGLTIRTFQNGGAAFLTLAGQSSLSGIASAFGTAPDGSSFLLLQAS